MTSNNILLFSFILTHPSFVIPEFHSVLSMTKTLRNSVIDLTSKHISTLPKNDETNKYSFENCDMTHDNNLSDNEKQKQIQINKIPSDQDAKSSSRSSDSWRIDRLEKHYEDIIYCQSDLSNFSSHAFIKFPSSQFENVLSDVKNYFLKRCVLLDSVYLFYEDYQALRNDCLLHLRNNLELFKTYRIDIVSSNKRLTLEQVQTYRQKYVDWILEISKEIYQGDTTKYPKVDLKTPEVIFSIIMDFEKLGKNLIGEFFARNLGESNRRYLLSNYALNKREYIGTTSMTPLLSFLSANQALVSNSLVLDPFVGTGSILISCAHFDSYVMGTDLDIRVLKGTNDKNLHSNFKQYGLEDKIMFDVFRTCLSQQSIWKCSEIFDAIVTDPPYGKRESASKIGRNKPLKNDIIYEGHIPSRVQYKKDELMNDFLNLSARLIKIGGRLVYWLISDIVFRIEEDLPTHPCFKLICISENRLSKKHSRRLVTMEKILSYEEGQKILRQKRINNNSESLHKNKKQRLNEEESMETD